VTKPAEIHPRSLALASERKKAGFTQADLADAVGCSQSHVAHCESGRDIPSLDLCLRSATALGCLPSSIDPALPSGRQGEPTRIITNPNDLPDDLSGGDFIYKSPNPFARNRR
jgi:transcriptional regulator with XRE-family HTH domain